MTNKKVEVPSVIDSMDQKENKLKDLLSMPIEERRETIAKDLEKKKSQFPNIDSPDLAEALGVPDPWHPINGEWSFDWYAESISLEDYVECNDPISVMGVHHFRTI